MQDNKLIQNVYIDTDVYDVMENQEEYLRDTAQFRQYMERKNIPLGNINFATDNQQINNLVESSETVVDNYNAVANRRPELGPFLSQQEFLRTDSIRYNTQNNQSDNSLALKVQELSSNPRDRFVQEQISYANVDSRDRDQALYPNPNSYRITLRRVYNNVSSIRLDTSEFINTQQTIRDAPLTQKNNIIQWQTPENVADGPIYTATLTPGTYNDTTLAAEIEKQMNAVPTDTGGVQTFEVTIDSFSNITTFTSVQFTAVANPLNTVAGSNVVTVNYPLASTLVVGQTIIIEGATDTGGLSSFILNSSHIVTGIGANSFTFNAPQDATDTVSGGGGDAVNIGVGVLFRLLFGEPFSPAKILGFAEVNTPYDYIITNESEIFNDPLNADLDIAYILPDPSDNTRSEITTLTNHSLNVGDRIYIYDTERAAAVSTEVIIPYTHSYNQTPLTDQAEVLRDQYVEDITTSTGWLVATIPSDTQFTIELEYQDYDIANETYPTIEDYIENVLANNNNVSSETFVTTEPAIGEPDSTTVEYIDTDFVDETITTVILNEVKTTTTVRETLLLQQSFGSVVQIDKRIKINKMLPFDVNSPTSITEVTTVLPHGLATGDRIYIYDTTVADAPENDYDPYTHLYGTTALNSTEDEIRATFVGAVTIPSGLIVTVTGTNTFTLPIQYGEYITINNEPISDWIEATVGESNVWGDIVLRSPNSAIDLTGEQYMFMVSEKIGGNIIPSHDFTNGPIFAKIQIGGGANFQNFNTYGGANRIYYETPLTELAEIDFAFYTHDGVLVEFNGKDHSFILEITESLQKLEGTGFNARIGART